MKDRASAGWAGRAWGGPGLAGLAALLVPLTVLNLAGQENFPSPAPVVQSVFPRGIAAGSSVEVELRGRNLEGLNEIEFRGRGVSGEIVSARPSVAKVRVTAAPGAETGRRDFRVRSSKGVYVGLFEIGSLPEAMESEPNDDWRKAQPIRLPAVVNGVVRNEDYDHFAFTAEPGRTYVFHVMATRNGSRLDAELAVLDRQGNELLWSDDDTIFGDPHLEFRPPAAGEYVLRVGSLSGGPFSEYRLVAGEVPYVNHTLPAGLSAGKVTEITLHGVNLDQATGVWLGDRKAQGVIVSKSDRALVARLTAPASLAPGPYWLHVGTAAGEIPIPVRVQVSHLPEVTVGTPPSTLAHALPISGPVVVNGAIAEHKGSHYFKFHAEAGARYVFRADSMNLGYHLDPAITLLDAGGNKLAFADDPGIDERADEYQLDPHLSYRFEESGTYVIAIRDAMYRGRGDLVYRLTVEPAEPDFTLELRDSVKSLYAGQPDTLQVRVRRRAGWNAPVRVWAESLPPGVEVKPQTAEPVDSIVKDTCGVERVIDGTIVLLPVEAAATATGRAPVVIKAAGEMEGRRVEKQALVIYERYAAGYIYGPMEVQRAELTVLPAPRALLTAPETLTVKPGGTARLEVGVRRFLDLRDQPLTLRLAGGIAAEPVAVSTGARVAEITLQIRPGAGSQEVPLTVRAVTESGEVVAESAAILVKISHEE